MKTAFLGIALGLMAGAVWAGDAKEGAALYERHCATCHGLDATGHGPMAGILVIKPADLTALSQEGEFPLARVVKRIDGRDPLVAHGSPMPVYGGFFEGRDVALKTASGQPIFTSEGVADLVAYIETLQTP